jgi:GNAT superfamily N-acetyltransferase
MAALTRPMRARVRAPMPGEGGALASLWRQLWDAHEQWGGYPGSRDAAVYRQLAARLDEEARSRAGRPIVGGHLHLVADLGDAPCGQVEGWLEHDRASAPASFTCEVRSLIVGDRVRRFGVGRALLDALEKAVRSRFPGDPCVLAAEVLEPNPAHDFYARVGFSPVAWSARLDTARGLAILPGPRALAARMAVPDDAAAIAHLDEILAARRIAAGDRRFAPPPAIDRRLVSSIAAHLADEAWSTSGDHGTIVVADAAGVVRGVATLAVQTLEPPFVPIRRGLVGRFALDPASPAADLTTSLVALGARIAASRGASRLELTDLTAPGSELYESVLGLGALPWSRVVMRRA